MVIGHQGAFDGLAGAVVVPDHGRQGEDALQDPGGHSGGGLAAVAFQVELAFEGVVDRFDDLAQRFQEPGSGPVWLALAGRAQQADAAVGQGGLEAGAELVLVADDDLPGAAGRQGRVCQDAQQHLPLVLFSACQREPDGRPVQGVPPS